MSLAEYARRKGLSPSAITRAITGGRLVQCLARKPAGGRTDLRGGKFYIADAELADREWEANSHRLEARLVAGAPPAPTPTALPAPAEEAEPPLAARAAGLSEIGTARRRFEEARAEMMELDLAAKRGDLVSVSEARAAVIEKLLTVRTKLLGLAVRVRQRLPHLGAADVGIIDALIREALTDLAGSDTAAEERAAAK